MHILSFSRSQDSGVASLMLCESFLFHFWSIECLLRSLTFDGFFVVALFFSSFCRHANIHFVVAMLLLLPFIYLFMYPFLSHELVFIIGCIYVVKLCGKVAESSCLLHFRFFLNIFFVSEFILFLALYSR